MTVENWTLANLQHLIGQEETSSLEFKRSDALSNTDNHKKELVKDVTALANAAGGIIVYGIVEQNGTATAIDDGCDVVPEWIEQVLESNAEPKVTGVVVQRIPVTAARYAFAIEVPQATALAPHQSKQHHQYFRRHGRKALPMLDHEIRDLMRRGLDPHLYFKWVLNHRVADQYRLRIWICNKAQAPAEYGTAMLCLSSSLEPPGRYPAFEEIEIALQDGETGVVHPAIGFRRNFNLPGHLPIFREQDWLWMETTLTVERDTRHPVSYTVACPGFSRFRSGFIVRGPDLVATVEWQQEE